MWSWERHGDAAHILKPHNMSIREQKIIGDALFSEGQLGRHELLSFLKSKEGREAWTGENELTVYQAFLRSSASEETKNIVEAILAFEAMAKLLNDAFHQVLSHVEQGAQVKTEKLCSLPAVILAAEKVGDSCQRVLEVMSLLEWRQSVKRSKAVLRSLVVCTATEPPRPEHSWTS